MSLIEKFLLGEGEGSKIEILPVKEGNRFLLMRGRGR